MRLQRNSPGTWLGMRAHAGTRTGDEDEVGGEGLAGSCALLHGVEHAENCGARLNAGQAVQIHPALPLVQAQAPCHLACHSPLSHPSRQMHSHQPAAQDCAPGRLAAIVAPAAEV